MAHLEKFSRGTIGHALGHDCRQQDDGVKRSNEKIDNSRTHLNYSLHPHSEQPMDFINRRTSEVRCMKRDDVVVAGSWVVTLPKEYKGDERRFFEETYRFLADRYGEKNVISAWVHNDETTPHLHFKFVPVVEGKKGEKVCMKECCPRSDYQTFHTDLEKYLCEHLGIDKEQLGVLNGATDNGNKTIQELKAQSLEQQNSRSKQELINTQQEIDQKQQELTATNTNITKAAEQLGDILGKKQRAAKIHKPLKDIFKSEDTVTVDRAVWNDIGAVKVEMVNAAQKAAQSEQTMTYREQAVLRKEQEIEPLHRQAEQERKQAQRLRENAEQLISEQANALAAKMLQAIPPEQRDRTRRMEKFMQSVEYSDGTTVLEHFEDSERQLLESARNVKKSRTGYDR